MGQNIQALSLIRPLLSALIFTLLFTGCSKTIVYDSNILPVPLANHAGKLTVHSAYGNSGASVNASFSLPGQFVINGGLQYNASSGDHQDPFHMPTDGYFNDAHMFRDFEFSAGPYFDLDDDVVLEIFIGKGHGSGEDYVYTNEFWNWKSTEILQRETGSFDKIFGQLNIGRHTEKSRTGFAIRCSYIDFRDYELVHSQRGIEKSGMPSGLIWEPMVFAEVGTKRVKFTVNMLYPIAPSTLEFGFRNFVIAAGLAFDIF